MLCEKMEDKIRLLQKYKRENVCLKSKIDEYKKNENFLVEEFSTSSCFNLDILKLEVENYLDKIYDKVNSEHLKETESLVFILKNVSYIFDIHEKIYLKRKEEYLRELNLNYQGDTNVQYKKIKTR